jgi:hypothetical protein
MIRMFEFLAMMKPGRRSVTHHWILLLRRTCKLLLLLTSKPLRTLERSGAFFKLKLRSIPVLRLRTRLKLKLRLR